MPAERKTPSTATWRSVVQRDRQADADFVYVALTTGIYCRPSCPARLPQRRDVIVFPTADEAARHGYSACRRCHSAAGSLAPAEKSIKAALEYIEAHLDRAITLRALSRIAGTQPEPPAGNVYTHCWAVTEDLLQLPSTCSTQGASA